MSRPSPKAGSPEDAASEYAFLVGTVVDRETLDHAIVLARRWGVAPHEVLLARGWIPADDYIEALARYLGVISIGEDRTAADGQRIVMLDGTIAQPWEIASRVAAHEAAGELVILSPTYRLHDVEPSHLRADRLTTAVAGLLRWRPVMSAGAPTWRWQVFAATIALGLTIGGIATAPDVVYHAVLMALTAAFLPMVVLRLAILVAGIWPLPAIPRDARVPDAELPVYTLLVPMFRESAVLRQLVDAISKLDYPHAKLDVLLVLESVDVETRAAAAVLDLPGFIRVIVVPDRQPRTKPKALNYALKFARGDFVVVFDAEDMPQPDQLRRALATFRASSANTFCLQGRLNIHNTHDGWLVRQFALEYAVLFGLTLPGLVRLNLPVPLGGTSNHFPRAVLERWSGWDPFNVTEDADLGIRLRRTGGRIGMLDSVTWEEAPERFGVWLRQRTRWLKGWMQTYLVHNRQPIQLWRDLGPAAFVGFHLYSGGLILSALVFPIFCTLAVVDLWRGYWLSNFHTPVERIVWAIAVFNLATAYVGSVVAAWIAAWRMGSMRLALGAFLMPVYWLLISLAAYRALFQLMTSPYRWEKTEHRPRTSRVRIG